VERLAGKTEGVKMINNCSGQWSRGGSRKLGNWEKGLSRKEKGGWGNELEKRRDLR